MTTIKDSVHDHIEIEGAAEALLDMLEIQHLRHIKQLGTVQLVYPSANHTRFEHSLGVYHLASCALSHLGIEGDAAVHVEAMALLHDVGHGLHSHNIEGAIHRHTGKYYDDVEGLVARGTVGEMLEDEGLDPGRVAVLVEGDGGLGQLVSGELDVDWTDYLVRDAHHTGVSYNTIDHERLIRELTFVDGELVPAERSVQTTEPLLLARTLMSPTVYQHHVARISKVMLRCASERLFGEGTDAEELRRMDDPDLLVTLRLTDLTGVFAERLATCDPYKRVVWAELPNILDLITDAEHDALVMPERDVAAVADVSSELVIPDVSSCLSITESSSRVMVNDEMRQLERELPLVQAFWTAQEQQWRLGVYAPREETERVGRVAADVLGPDADGALVAEVRSGLNVMSGELE